MAEGGAEDTDINNVRRILLERVETVCTNLLNPSYRQDLQDALLDIDQITEAVSCLDYFMRIPDEVYDDISSARKIIERSCIVSTRAPQVKTNMPGRPAYDISREQLQSLIDLGFTVPQIKDLLHVSTRTIERRLAEYSITSRPYTLITDEELDFQVRDIKTFNPNCGSKLLTGCLASRDIKVQRYRIRDSLRRVDPIGVYIRKCWSICRRTYFVSRPLALWHFDGNHKLIRWRFVVHGCVDGYSRVPVYIVCKTDNKATSVFGCFIEAVSQWGLPSRVRCDKGGENIDIVQYMIERKGTGRGSALVGRSVHNQRIERMWRDVFSDVLHFFYDLFHLMEDVGILDPASETDLWCLQLCYLPLINYRLKEWIKSWIRHPLSSEGNLTPLQLWVRGQFENASAFPLDGAVPDDYGIDWEGPATTDCEDNIGIPITDCPLTQNQLDELGRIGEEEINFSVTTATPWTSVEWYLVAKHFVKDCIESTNG